MPTDHTDLGGELLAHYDRPGLAGEVLDALRDAGVEPSTMTREDVAAVGEFHVGGRAATRALADLADLGPGTAVLDVGCGLGGPARTLAAEYDCRVTGVDLVGDYCRTAATLNRALGLDDRVACGRADVRALPFDDGRFGAVWLQHVTPNVPDRDGLFSELRRATRDGGALALHEVVAGPGGDPDLPVPWASDGATNFLAAPAKLRSAATGAGFRERAFEDVTDETLAWFDGTLDDGSGGPSGPDIGLVLGEDAVAKSKNLVRNLREQRVQVVRATFEAV